MGYFFNQSINHWRKQKTKTKRSCAYTCIGTSCVRVVLLFFFLRHRLDEAHIITLSHSTTSRRINEESYGGTLLLPSSLLSTHTQRNAQRVFHETLDKRIQKVKEKKGNSKEPLPPDIKFNIFENTATT